MRVEKNEFTGDRFLAYQSGIMAFGKTSFEALKKILDWNVREHGDLKVGWCYHTDCDDDHCRCWDDPVELEREIGVARELQKKAGITPEIVDEWERNRQKKLKVIHFEEEKIDCDCNDPSCPGEGLEGEVGGHIEECACHDCHHALGKL